MVNRVGDIYSVRSQKLLKYSISSSGYKQYVLYKDGKKKCVFAHKIVALAFVPNPNAYSIVNHKDENKLNCTPENLEWRTIQYNNNYGSKKCATEMFDRHAKEFYVYDTSLNFVGKFRGTRRFAMEHGITSGTFSSTLTHNSKDGSDFHSCKGYIPIDHPL